MKSNFTPTLERLTAVCSGRLTGASTQGWGFSIERQIMKAQLQNQETFIPVLLTLETQAEVDAIYALLNFSTLQKAVGFDARFNNPLFDFRDVVNVDNLHVNICNAIK